MLLHCSSLSSFSSFSSLSSLSFLVICAMLLHCRRHRLRGVCALVWECPPPPTEHEKHQRSVNDETKEMINPVYTTYMYLFGSAAVSLRAPPPTEHENHERSVNDIVPRTYTHTHIYHTPSTPHSKHTSPPTHTLRAPAVAPHLAPTFLLQQSGPSTTLRCLDKPNTAVP